METEIIQQDLEHQDDEYDLESGEQVPQNESVLFLVTQYGELRTQDMKTLSQVSKEGHKAAKPYMTFSESKFKKFMHDCTGNSFYGNPDMEIEELLKLEQQICDLIDLNHTNDEFRVQMSEWITLMNQPEVTYGHENDRYTRQIETNDPTETLRYKADQLVERAQKSVDLNKPSFRKGIRKLSKGVAGTVAGVGVVLSLPIALLGIPFMLRHGHSSGKSGIFLGPLYLTCMLTYQLFKGINEPNFRNTRNYIEFKKITKNIETKLAEYEQKMDK